MFEFSKLLDWALILSKYKQKTFIFTENYQTMENVIFDTTPQEYIIRVEKNSVHKDFIDNIYEQIRLEALAQEMNTDEDFLMNLAKKSKGIWWRNNERRVLQRIEEHQKALNEGKI